MQNFVILGDFFSEIGILVLGLTISNFVST